MALAEMFHLMNGYTIAQQIGSKYLVARLMIHSFQGVVYRGVWRIKTARLPPRGQLVVGEGNCVYRPHSVSRGSCEGPGGRFVLGWSCEVESGRDDADSHDPGRLTTRRLTC